MWPCHVPTPALCPRPRNDRLWICMEFCGGGSLQEIYHGEGQDSSLLPTPTPTKGRRGEVGCWTWFPLYSSLAL